MELAERREASGAGQREDELFVFGGEVLEANKTRVFSDFYRYQCRSNQWTHVVSSSGPPPRSAHQVRAQALITIVPPFCTSHAASSAALRVSGPDG